MSNFYLLTTVVALPGVLLFWWMSADGAGRPLDRHRRDVEGEGDARAGDAA